MPNRPNSLTKALSVVTGCPAGAFGLTSESPCNKASNNVFWVTPFTWTFPPGMRSLVNVKPLARFQRILAIDPSSSSPLDVGVDPSGKGFGLFKLPKEMN